MLFNKFISITLIAAVMPCVAMARGSGSHTSHTSHTSPTPPHTSHSSDSKTHVSGYTRKDGTHVDAHNRSHQDKTKENNWSTKGNVNPETGKAGTKSGD